MPSPDHVPWFFDGWYNLGRAAGLAFIGFLALIVVLRASGKRTLSKMNVFDFVFVVAVGSLFAAAVVDKSVTLIEGLVAMTVLVLVQTALAALAARSVRFERLLNGEPTLLFSHGDFLHRAMKKERITEEEVRAAIREQGIERVEDVDAVVLENDGSLTVAYHAKRAGKSSLVDATASEGDGISQKSRRRG